MTSDRGGGASGRCQSFEKGPPYSNFKTQTLLTMFPVVRWEWMSGHPWDHEHLIAAMRRIEWVLLWLCCFAHASVLSDRSRVSGIRANSSPVIATDCCGVHCALRSSNLFDSMVLCRRHPSAATASGESLAYVGLLTPTRTMTTLSVY